MAIHGMAGDDDLSGSAGDDVFVLSGGGEDTASGGDGNDTFRMGASLDAGDHIDGGAGDDTIRLEGDYSAGLTFIDKTMQSVETLILGGAFHYNLTLADGNVAADERLSIGAATLKSTGMLTFDGSAETDGHFTVTGGAGNDVLTGGAQSDLFNLTRGGDDTVQGGDGDDVFKFGAAFTKTDVVDGGAGDDTLIYAGQAHSLVAPLFSERFVTGIDKIVLAGGLIHQVDFSGDVTGGSPNGLTIDAHTRADTVIFDLTDSDSASFHVVAGSGDDVVWFGTNFSGDDTVDGRGGYNTVELHGIQHLEETLGAKTLKNVDLLDIFDFGLVTLTLNDGNVAAGRTLKIVAEQSGMILRIDGSAERDGSLVLNGSTGEDTLTGGQGDDNLHGGQGHDVLTGNGGADVFRDGNYAQSYGVFHDTITDFTAGTDKLDIEFAVVGVSAVENHSVSEDSFTDDLRAAGNGDAGLQSHGAHIVHADSGDLAGHDYLIVDVIGSAQYDANGDYVIDITGYSGTITVGDFI